MLYITCGNLANTIALDESLGSIAVPGNSVALDTDDACVLIWNATAIKWYFVSKSGN